MDPDPWIRTSGLRIRGSVPLVYGSGSCSFLQWFSRFNMQTKLCSRLLLTLGTFTSVFKGKKLSGIVEIKIFRNFFCFFMEGTKPDPYRKLQIRIREDRSFMAPNTAKK